MISGDHVGLRAIERADLGQLLEWRNRPDLRRFFREHRELSESDQERWFVNVVGADPGTAMFAIERLADNALVGAAGLCQINWRARSADLSLYIGLGGVYVDDLLAPEAAQLLIAYGFGELALHRIWVEVYAFDDAKHRLVEQLGFTQEGTHRESHYADGEWHDVLSFGLLKHEAT